MRFSVHTMATVAALAFPLLIGSQSQADMIPVGNPSFEVLGAAWTFDINNETGTFVPSAALYPGGIPDGLWVGYSNGGTISQVLTAGLSLGTYTLLVDIGNRPDLPFGGYDVELLAGGTLLAHNDTLSPAPGTFLTSTITYIASAGDPLLGQSLEIRLIGNGVQTNYDNVRLDFAPASVPEPASLMLLGTGSVGLLGYTWRRRARTSA